MKAPFTHVAVCVDNSEASTVAMEEAWQLHRTFRGSRFSLVHVIPPPTVIAGHGVIWLPDPNEIAAGAKEWMQAAAAAYAEAEIVLLEGYPAAAVCDWAAEIGVDLLVASSSRGLFDRVLLGSFAGYLSHHAPCSVLLTRPRSVREERSQDVVVEAATGS